MDKLIHKYEQLTLALKTLEKAISALHNLEARGENFNPKIDYQDQYRTNRDSVIQRFEYSIDLFWKYLKTYLEAAHVSMQIKTPGEVIRHAFSVGLAREEETSIILEMIKSRNMTSHIYVEEIAEQLVISIPVYYRVLDGIVARLIPQKNQ